MSMYTHELNAVKGWPSPYAVDKHADLADPNETVIAGQVMSLDSNAKFVLGLSAGAMPIFALQNSTDLDVVGDRGNLVGGGNEVPRMSGLVAVGAYELESTEFDSGAVYAPNTALTAGAVAAGDAGVIKVGQPFIDTLCGVVSDGVITNERGIDVLRFWPTWLPAISAEVSESLAL